MIKIQLSSEQQKAIECFRKQASSKDSEKALMVLMSNDGRSVPEIAKLLKRNPHTVRCWLKRYRDHGMKGLGRHFSPGRPDTLRVKVQEHIRKIIGHSPQEYGYQDRTWSVYLIHVEINKHLNINAGSRTVTRALKNMGYVYKRPSKAVSVRAASREEKQKAIQKMVEEIRKKTDQKEYVIYTLDETHFSNEPYLVRGWFKKR